MRKEKAIQIAIIFIFCALISSCINTLENSLTANPHLDRSGGAAQKHPFSPKKKECVSNQTPGARWFTKLDTNLSPSRSSIVLAATTVFIAFAQPGI